jgi:tetratricopeptide (TPR) repeat protein
MSEENYRMLGRIHTQVGAYDEAERALREAVSLSPETAYATAALGYLYGVRGDRAAAEQVLVELAARGKTGYVSPVAVCMVYAGLGMVDETFAWLDRAYEERRGWLAYLKVEPTLDGVRDDPRFTALVRRMKL